MKFLNRNIFALHLAMAKKIKALDEELSSVISTIVDCISDECVSIELEIRNLQGISDSTLAHLAKIADAKIRKKQTDRLRKKMLAIIKSSRNRIIVSSIDVSEN